MNTTKIATLTQINRQIGPDEWVDVITITQGDEEIAVLHVEPAEDQEPYDEALRAAGHGDAVWAPGGAN